MTDVAAKLTRVRAYMKEHDLDAVVFSSRANFAWLTCGGDNHVVAQSDSGQAAVMVTARQVCVIADAIEGPRIEKEEPVNGFTLKTHPWTQDLGEAVRKAVGSKKQAATDEPWRMDLPPLPGDFNHSVRAELCPGDIRRYRQLGRDCAIAIETVAQHMSVGDSGHVVEADLSRHLLVRGIQPHVLLVGFDDRLRRSRHPIPSVNHLRHLAMLVVCGQRGGLIANLTRMVHFGPLSAELKARHASVCKVEATMWEATQPGRAWKDVFKAAQKAYKDEGFDKEWEQHHQGGPTGYAGRDFLVTPQEDRLIHNNQAVAWNPSISGTKSEDTFIVNEEGRQVLTACSKNWPVCKVRLPGGVMIERPDILVR
ncbi:MAG: M24 family metallopeptidase [Planctomycetota bacterium]